MGKDAYRKWMLKNQRVVFCIALDLHYLCISERLAPHQFGCHAFVNEAYRALRNLGRTVMYMSIRRH